MNKYRPHIVIVPEDDANRQIATGFNFCSNVNNRLVQVLPTAGGWCAVLERFEKDHLPKMREYPAKRVLLLIDFDDDYKNRANFIQEKIPEEFRDRVFVLGAATEPEAVKRSLKKNYEEIGFALAKGCPQTISTEWDNPLLAHNKAEIRRMAYDLQSFLFV